MAMLSVSDMYYRRLFYLSLTSKELITFYNEKITLEELNIHAKLNHVIMFKLRLTDMKIRKPHSKISFIAMNCNLRPLKPV